MNNMTSARRGMIERLVTIQNAPGNEHIDILTITGFMTDEQVAAHLARYEAQELTRVFNLKGRRRAA
ncbi:MAG: hypothetical protein GEV06_19875 [Luteitalea sp.]|nr:hypothetical protein [Luteitalea sp.]